MEAFRDLIGIYVDVSTCRGQQLGFPKRRFASAGDNHPLAAEFEENRQRGYCLDARRSRRSIRAGLSSASSLGIELGPRLGAWTAVFAARGGVASVIRG